MNQTLQDVLSGFQPPVVPPAVLQCKDGIVQAWCSLHLRKSLQNLPVLKWFILLQHILHLEVTKLLKCFAQEMEAKLLLDGLSQDK